MIPKMACLPAHQEPDHGHGVFRTKKFDRMSPVANERSREHRRNERRAERAPHQRREPEPPILLNHLRALADPNGHKSCQDAICIIDWPSVIQNSRIVLAGNLSSLPASIMLPGPID